MVEQVHCSRRTLPRRGREFHACNINKSAHMKKSGNLSNEPCIYIYIYIYCHLQTIHRCTCPIIEAVREKYVESTHFFVDFSNPIDSLYRGKMGQIRLIYVLPPKRRYRHQYVSTKTWRQSFSHLMVTPTCDTWTVESCNGICHCHFILW